MDANPYTPTLGCSCGCHALAKWLKLDRWKCDSCHHVVTDQRFTGPITRPLAMVCSECEREAAVLDQAGTPFCGLHSAPE